MEKLIGRLLLTHNWKCVIVHILHTSVCNGPLHGEVNGIDYCFAIFGVLSHLCCVVNATCCYIALVRWMLKWNVIDVGERSTDLEKIGKLVKRLIREDAETGNICDIEEL